MFLIYYRQIKKSESQIETLKDDIIECKKNMESYKEELKKNEILLEELNDKNKEITVSVFIIIYIVLLHFFVKLILKVNFVLNLIYIYIFR